MPENSTNRGYPLPVAGDAFTPQAGVNALGVAVDADVQALADDVADASGIDNGAIGPAKLDRAYAESGNYDVRIGIQAGLSIGDAYSQSIAIGAQALRDNPGVSSVAIGYQSQKEASPDHSTAVGHQTQRTASGVSSVAVGRSAQENASGANSVAVGVAAQQETSGPNSVAVGPRAQLMASGDRRTSVGALAAGYNVLVVGGTSFDDFRAGARYLLSGTNLAVDGVPRAAGFYDAVGGETATADGDLFVNWQVNNDVTSATEIGSNATADHPGGIALGYNAFADTDRQVQVGTSVTVNGVAPPNALRVGVHDAILTTDTPTTGEVLRFDGSAWVADGAATAAQGALADSAVQPGDLAAVATSGAYGDLSGLPTLGTAAATDASAYATAAQGVKADAAAPAATIGNLLTTDEANAVAANWQGIRIDCTVTDAGGTPSPAAGSSVFKLTRVGSPSFTFMYTQQGTSPSTTYGAPVVPGQWYTFSVYVRGDAANATQGNVQVQVVFRSAAGAAVSTPTSGVTAVSASEWRRLVYVVQAPATAAVAQVRPYFTSLVTGHIAYVSGVQVNAGAGGSWAPPGVVINDAPTRVKPTDAAVMQLWNPSTSAWVDAAASSSVVFGTTAGTATEGNDTRVVNAVQNTRQVATGSGLTGGGNLTADRTLAVDFTAVATAAQGALAEKVEIGVACSDETTDLATGTAKVTFRLPHAMTLTAVRASVTTAPVGSALTVDINAGGASVLSTLLTIDAGEKTSTTAATPAVIGTSALADDAEITVDIDAVGSSTAGAGLKVWLIGTRA